MARTKVREDGFNFKKGVSRSKFSKVDGDDVPKKRPKSTSDERRGRLEQIDKAQSEIEKSIKIKEQRRSKAESVKDFALCDTLSTEIRGLLKEKHILENERKVLNRKESQAKWFTKKRSQGKNENEKKSEKSENSSSATLDSLWSKRKETSSSAATSTTTPVLSNEDINHIECTSSAAISTMANDNPDLKNEGSEESTVIRLEEQEF